MTEVVTGEAVVLEVPCARFPSRAVALAIDLAIQFFLTFILLTIAGLGAESRGLDTAATAAIAITITVLILVGYPVLWETATRGRSPGKFALGLRVVGDDGSPERFRQALVRGLATVVDFWIPPFFFVPALVCSLLSEKGKRLGDVVAGTFVIQQRLPARRGVAVTPSLMPPELAGWAAGLELSALTDQAAAMARRYLGRQAELTPGARAELGQRIAAAVSAQVSPPPPPGTPVQAYLAAVLAERNRREHARLMPADVSPGFQPAGPAGFQPPGPVSGFQPPGGSPSFQPPGATPPPRATPPPPGTGTAWKRAVWEGEGSEPGQAGDPADPPGGATGGFVPPQ